MRTLGGNIEMSDTYIRQGALGSTSNERGWVAFLDSRIPTLTPENLNPLITTTVEEILQRHIGPEPPLAKMPGEVSNSPRSQ